MVVQICYLLSSLIKITTTNDEEIICIRLTWSDGAAPGGFDYTIISNQDIAGNDIEIKSETELINFEFYPVLKDAKKYELSSTSGEDIATEGAVVKYVNNKISELNNTYALKEHKHTMADITDLELPEFDTSNLATKTELTGKADLEHTHTISDITNLQTSLDNKANVNHTHTISDITNLQTSLDNKANVNHTHSNYAVNNHTHSEYATKTELNGKANSSHKHTMADITDLEIPEIDTSNFASKDHTHESLTSTDGDFSITVDTKRILINYADNQIRITGSSIDISNDRHCLLLGSNHIMWTQYSTMDQVVMSFRSSGVEINGRKILTE